MIRFPELPHEIWLEVMSHLTYNSLKSCIRVNKTFQRLTQHASLNETLFRSKNVIPADSPGAIDVDDIEIHPAFDCFDLSCPTMLSDIVHYDEHDQMTPLTMTSAAEEYATFPTVGRLRMKIMNNKLLDVRSATGVTVIQTMQTLCKFYSKGAFEAVGDRTGWNGWEAIKLDRKGNIYLLSAWFDS